jgi:hypothetical protein
VPRLLAALLVATCVVALSACGGGGGSAGGSAEPETKTVGVDAYTSSVCSALSNWLDNLANASAVFANTTNNETDLTKVRSTFVTFFGGAIDETDRMVEEVQAAGRPDLDNGDLVRAALLRELATFRPILVDAKGRAEKLPVDKPARFTKLAQTLGAGFRIETTKVETLFDLLGRRFKAPQLSQAAAADANCRALSP